MENTCLALGWSLRRGYQRGRMQPEQSCGRHCALGALTPAQLALRGREMRAQQCMRVIAILAGIMAQLSFCDKKSCIRREVRVNAQ